jgi:uncharacterized paraquat-inducible protein A
MQLRQTIISEELSTKEGEIKMFGIGWPELVLILSVFILILPILIVYYFIKYAVRKGVKETLEERRVPSSQATTRICPHCERGVSEEAKFCPQCGKKL